MDEGHAPRINRSRHLPLILLAILLAAIGFFFLDERFKPDYASLTAFFAIPAALGGLLAYAINVGHRTGGFGCIILPTLAVLAMVGLAWAVLGEGAICIVMVLPLWIPAAIGGYAVSWWNTHNQVDDDGSGVRIKAAAWLLFPMVILSFERIYPMAWEARTVSREVIVSATPERIWPLLVSIPEISSTEGEWNFTQDMLGVPRPEHAELLKRDGKLIRKAEWGQAIHFEEQIDKIVPNQSIAWTFEFPDRSIEHVVDHHISPKGDILRIETGRYDLVPISGGHTKIRLSTSYKMRTRLPTYLTLWGQGMLGDIQNNVLAIVKDRAEAAN